ncbi:MAG: hypothetical protein KID02_10995 [Clostridiales bacterium]|nr:hypothetical protein [Clostridiales bacterium]
MGTSNWQNMSYCIDILRKIKPRSILDVGVGFGRWGITSREFLEIWAGKVKKEDWKTEIHGIEAFKENIEYYHYYFYDKILNMDAKDYLLGCKRNYDLIIYGDVLEHFEKEDAIQLLDKSLKIAKYVLINIPIGSSWEQDELYDNPYEKHKSEWQVEDFSRYPIVREREFVDYLGRDFCSVLLSSESMAYNQLLYPHNIEKEIEMNLIEIEKHKQYVKNLEERKSLQEECLEEIIKVGESIMNSNETKKRVSITIEEVNNPNAQGNEVWIYHIGSDQLETMSFKHIKMDDKWLKRNDGTGPTNEVIIGSTPGACVEIDIIGDFLCIRCLSHPWSGKLGISVDDKHLMSVDLFSNTQKVVDFKINLKGD